MIDSLLEELPQRGPHEDGQEASAADTPPAESSENSFLAALPIVRRIVGRRRSPVDQTSQLDVIQEVALRLWRWRKKYQEKSETMSGDEWRAFAARTAYNEVNRHFSAGKNAPSVPLETVSDIEGASVEGQTEIEVFSLIRQVWQAICKLTLHQRRALLLNSADLLIYFLQCGVEEKSIFVALGLSKEEWKEIVPRLPLTDGEIAMIAIPGKRASNPAQAARAVKKARFDARTKLKRLIG